VDNQSDENEKDHEHEVSDDDDGDENEKDKDNNKDESNKTNVRFFLFLDDQHPLHRLIHSSSFKVFELRATLFESPIYIYFRKVSLFQNL
jgi:hypothetical protein